MPSILLINDNKIVSRLINLSSEKNDYKLTEIDSFKPMSEFYDIIFIDSDQLDEDTINKINSEIKYNKIGYIGAKGSSKPDGIDFILEKPFLPTDFVELVNSNYQEKVDDYEVHESEDELEELDLNDLKLPDEEEESYGNTPVGDMFQNNEIESNIEEDREEDDIEDILTMDGDNMTSVLDKEDVEEVKQLLDEDSVEESEQSETVSDLKEELEQIEDITDDIENESAPNEENLQKEESEDELLESSENQDEVEDEFAELSESSISEALGEKLVEDISEEDAKEKIDEVDEIVEEIVDTTKNEVSQKVEVESSDELKNVLLQSIDIATLQKALEGMEVNIKVTFNSKEK